jgi:oligo-1,6-glucosidase
MADFKKVFKTWDKAFERKGWGSVFLGNHDFPRMVSRWGNDKEHWEKSSKLLITLLLSMRGTPFIFQGDEIGMTNTKLNAISKSKDIETQNGWLEAQKKGIAEVDFLKAVNYSGRDNARTPLQWNAGHEGGFTEGEAWMNVNENKSEINVEAQNPDANSVLNYFRSMVSMRKNYPVLTYGSYLQLENEHEYLFSFTRQMEKEKLLIMLNFSDHTVKFPIEDLQHYQKLIGNYGELDPFLLRPWEAVILKSKI